jgi:hypothetical protein
MKPNFKPPGTKRLKLRCEIMLSTSAFKFNLRRYTKGLDVSAHGGRSYTEFQTTVFKFKTASGMEHSMVGRCRLTPSNPS